MTDPKGRDGTLVPLSDAPKFDPGAVPEGQREIPGARGTEEAAAGRDAFARPPPIRENGAGRVKSLRLMTRKRRSRRGYSSGG